MKKLTKLVALVLATLMLTFALTACGGSSSNDATIKFGTNAEFPPYEYIDGDMELQPTIKPVVDLSDVINSSNAISGMFDGTSSNIRAVSSFMNNRSQNGSNGDIISAIDKLRGDLSNLGNTYYTVEGVTYDDGSNIANAVAAIVREARIERRM